MLRRPASGRRGRVEPHAHADHRRRIAPGVDPAVGEARQADAPAELLEAGFAVAQRLAACVHMAPVASVYRWQGRVQHDDEVALVFKTTEAAAPQLRALLLAAHPYELPALYTLAVAEASAAYGEWIVQSTRCG